MASTVSNTSRLVLSAVRDTLKASSRLVRKVRLPRHNFYGSATLTSVRHASTSSNDGSISGTKPVKRYNVGVVGAGRIARVHLQNVVSHRRLNLLWVADDDQNNSALTRDALLLHNVSFHSAQEVENLLKDPKLDAVFVVSPTNTHSDLVKMSLMNGKAVFVEKPTAETREDIDSCYSLAERVGRPLLTGFQRRFDPTFQDLYNTVLEQKALGKIFNIKSVSRDSPKPSYEFLKLTDPMGCNIMSDMAVHDVDSIVWLTKGEQPESIYVITHAHDAELAETGVADTIMVVMKYKSGVIATIDSCRETTYGYDIRLEVFGSGGMATTDHQRESGCRLEGVPGGSVRRLHNSFPQRFEKAFKAEVDHFVRCIDGTEQPLVTRDQAMLTALIVEKGIQSFRQKAPVYFDQ